MAEQTSSLIDLPLDILLLVFPYLDAKSFLSLCSTCKAFQQPSIRLDGAYWSYATRSTFRVPNQPVVQSDGLRWQNMFRRLLTQSRVFTWGSNTHNCLGLPHGVQPSLQQDILPGRRRNQWARVNRNVSFPTEMKLSGEFGIIADMQCGGWSTTLLTSKGSLYTIGVLDGLHTFDTPDCDKPDLLKYPAGFPQSDERYEPSVATKQFSSGRSHILALSDSGRIWSWYETHTPALHVKFLHVDFDETPPWTNNYLGAYANDRVGRVRQVVAGWSHSSAYIVGTGIILWPPVKRAHTESDTDTMLVMDSAVVPKTTFKRTKITSQQSQEDKNLGEEVGMVTNYIILEHFVVFVTDMGKVFAARIEDDSETKDIMELYRLRNNPSTPSDVQGSFRHFAVFKNGGEVIITDQDYLERCWDVRFDNPTQIDIQGLQRVPALQNNDVISVAFGDYHYHALHSNGRITSYGDEPQGCGTLGLGTQAREDFAVIRGMKMTGFQNEGHLLPQTYTTGRQVWFEKEKLAWMEFMAAGGYDPAESQERMALARNDLVVRGEVSEWFEQQSRDWDKRPELTKYDEDGLGAYFALSVSAAGWHSGALVLVNASLVEQLHESCSMKNSKARTVLPAASTESNDEAESSNPDDSGPSGPFSGLGASITRWLGHAGRQFLGLPSADRIPRTNPRDEVAYIWGADSFPRLRLSDGRELPGTVPISTWEGPEFKSDFHI